MLLQSPQRFVWGVLWLMSYQGPEPILPPPGAQAPLCCLWAGWWRWLGNSWLLGEEPCVGRAPDSLIEWAGARDVLKLNVNPQPHSPHEFLFPVAAHYSPPHQPDAVRRLWLLQPGSLEGSDGQFKGMQQAVGGERAVGVLGTPVRGQFLESEPGCWR